MRALPVLRSERGVSLVELLIALVVLTLGVLAVERLFPAGTRGQNKNKMFTTAGYFAQEQIEQLRTVPWTDALLSTGTHPATGYDSLGTTGQWRWNYTVEVLTTPLDNLKKVSVTVNWDYLGPQSTTATTYLRR